MMERMRIIHSLLHSKKYPTLKYLAESCEVKTRTIRRDFIMIHDRMGAEVVWNQEKGGYEYNGEVAPLCEILLTEEELQGMMVAAQALQGAQFGTWGLQMSRAMEKISDLLPPDLALSLTSWEDAITFHSIGEQKFDAQLFNKVIDAIIHRKQLLLTYATPNQEPGERIIEPYWMAFINREWNLFAFCYKRGKIVCFVPLRQIAVVETGKTFVRPADFRIDDQLEGTFGVYRGDVLQDVVVRFKPKAAHETRERHWPDGHELKTLPDGSVDLCMKLWHLQDIHDFLLRMGGRVIPVQPPELVQMYVSTSRRMHEEGLEMLEQGGLVAN